MIRNDLIQAAIVAKLKANTTLVNWLTARSAGSEIREATWQGRDFVYPCVRVQVGTQEPDGNGPCYTTNGSTTFTLFSYSEHDSSQECDELAGVANAALLGLHIAGTGFTTGPVLSDALIKATRTGERVWESVGLYRMQVYGQ